MLISAMVGIDSRATMDIDTTLRNYPLNCESAEQIVRQRPYQSGDFPFRERVLFLMLSAKAVLLAAHGLGLARRIAENQSVAVSGIEDLDEHGAAFADHRKRVAVGTQLVQKTVDVNGKDLRERLLSKAFFSALSVY